MELILPSQALRQAFVGNAIFNKNVAFKTEVEIEKSSFHAFRIGNMGILLPVNIIKEVIEELDYCQLPNTSEVLYGMANLRGNIIPIFDLHAQFNIEIKQNINRKILVIGKGSEAAAILIDELPIAISIELQNCSSETPPLPKVLQKFVNNTYKVKNTTWLDIDLTGLFFKLSEFI
jgi:twitching motility protein PilI